jgi:hypothetical protein
MNRTIQERTVSMLHHSRPMEDFWDEALLTAVHIINMSLSKPLRLKIPQELWTRKKSNYEKLRIVKCKAYALVSKVEHHKLKSWSQKCIFLGYGRDGSFSYRLWDPETHQLVRSLDVVFNEFTMHKAIKHPLELRRVTFADIPTLLDGPKQHTRSASGSTNPPNTVLCD